MDIAIWNWKQGPKELKLAAGEFHVWRAELDVASDELDSLANLLTAEEVARADRFRFAKDRKAFTARRGALRILIGRYLGGAPFREPLPLNSYGMPHLPPGNDGLHFNLSDSAMTALFAFARGVRIGIDIEAVRPDSDPCAIAERFFSPNEQRALVALPPEQRFEAFFACWARKEAYIKAHGMGLSLPLHSFDVSLAPGEPPAILATRHDPAEAGRWQMHALDAGAGFAAALVIEKS